MVPRDSTFYAHRQNVPRPPGPDRRQTFRRFDETRPASRCHRLVRAPAQDTRTGGRPEPSAATATRAHRDATTRAALPIFARWETSRAAGPIAAAAPIRPVPSRSSSEERTAAPPSAAKASDRETSWMPVTRSAVQVSGASRFTPCFASVFQSESHMRATSSGSIADGSRTSPSCWNSERCSGVSMIWIPGAGVTPAAGSVKPTWVSRQILNRAAARAPYRLFRNSIKTSLVSFGRSC